MFRALDIVGAAGAIVLALPLIASICLFIVLDGPGPILVRYRLVRTNGAQFDVLNFRTQQMDTYFPFERSDSSPRGGSSNYSRASKIGTILSVTRLNEIPMLVNVVAGNLPILGHYSWRQFIDWLSSADR
jgi:lipopolysaccharide/colanic/teichoic acid biosynthesis glycosyltransferase